ncbi:MAG: flagellar basal-body rod protein FlgG [Nevskiaceae bacterium]|nr:MAG: flagellar basal-body rod protein FlgG [Nevskiaceae bacterium]TBR71559.1 MAG: flagellar basal-body rod protein FlgG [Nevskiaceae bacterium]
MDGALWVAKTGLQAQDARMREISNNLANVNTTGFKTGRVNFADLLYQNVVQPGGPSSTQTQQPTGLMMGTGVRIVSTEKDFSEGTLEQTNNSLDVAINGRGFIQVQLPDGTLAYTRDGSLKIDSQGQLVTNRGYPIQPGVNLPNNTQSVTISSDGIVSAQVPGQAAPQQVGTLTLADFMNAPGLQPMGQNMYLETASSGPPQTGTPGVNGIGTLEQGMLEASNVNVASELVNMIETQRAYEMNSRAIQTSDQMLQFITQNL